MWNSKTCVMTGIIGENGTFPKICQELSERHVLNARFQRTTKEHTHTQHRAHT
jgi:hypothetical protein